MSRTLQLGLVLAGVVAALAAAYAAGMYYPLRAPGRAVPALAPVAAGDVAATVATFDYAAAVDVITSVRLRGGADDAGRFEHFEAVVDTLHRLALGYIAARLELTPEEQAAVFDEYAHTYRYAAVDYGPYLAAASADTVAVANASIVRYHSYDSVNEFVGVLSGQVCGLLRLPGEAMYRRVRGLAGRRRVEEALGERLTCGDVLGEVLAPVARALRRQAVVRDLNTSQLTITSHVRTMIAELGTAEEQITADFSDAYDHRFLFLKSQATIRARAEATVKVGFDLRRGFGVEVDHERRRFTVRLPAPEILSSEVDVSFVDVKNGMFVSIDLPKYNAALARARVLVEERALRADTFRAAKQNAEQIVLSIFQPVMALPQFGYDVHVAFPGDPMPEPPPAVALGTG